MPGAGRGRENGAVLFREDARLRQSFGTLRRGVGIEWRAPREFSASLHASGPDQRRLFPGSGIGCGGGANCFVRSHSRGRKAAEELLRTYSKMRNGRVARGLGWKENILYGSSDEQRSRRPPENSAPITHLFIGSKSGSPISIVAAVLNTS